MVMHFKSQKERLEYLRGDFNEIVLKKVEAPLADTEEEQKPKKKSNKKKEKKDGAVQSE